MKHSHFIMKLSFHIHLQSLILQAQSESQCPFHRMFPSLYVIWYAKHLSSTLESYPKVLRFCAITCITVTVLLTLLTFILVSLFKSVPFIASGSYEIPNPNRGNLPFKWFLRFFCWTKTPCPKEACGESVYLFMYLCHSTLNEVKAWN